jgi:uncharacterized protein (TIGR02466 family)
MKSSVQSLFPTPIYFSKLQRKFNAEEEKLINQLSKKVSKNRSNFSSTNTYVLEIKKLKKIKKELILRIQDYFENVLCYINVKPFITQSWLNYTKKNEYHHSHNHPNSIVSGIIYINANKKKDSITFLNEKFKQISPQIKNFNIWNSSTWTFPIETGDIILFPSDLVHMVKTKKESNVRISLSFNIFIKGIVGTEKQLMELELK